MFQGDLGMTEVSRGKFLYGVVTVGERGQIVIPKEARDQFKIKPGEKVIVVGDIEKGIGIVKADAMKELALNIMGVLGEVEKRKERKTEN
jgi:AbrB family looped-hinge helix DNA binding protein